jgi:competence protein ComEA
MLRRNFAGFLVLVLLTTMTLAAQVKEMPKTPVKSANAPRSVDINSAPPNDFVNLGIDAATAKKIVDGRPYRSKRDLVTREILTSDQYEKYKTELIARRPGTTTKTGTGKKKSN